jgi:hypothetical protein
MRHPCTTTRPTTRRRAAFHALRGAGAAGLPLAAVACGSGYVPASEAAPAGAVHAPAAAASATAYPLSGECLPISSAPSDAPTAPSS